MLLLKLLISLCLYVYPIPVCMFPFYMYPYPASVETYPIFNLKIEIVLRLAHLAFYTFNNSYTLINYGKVS